MTPERVFSFRNPWLWAAGGGTIAVAVIAALAGFLWFPSLQGATLQRGLWQSICTAAGVTRAPATRPADRAGETVSNAVLTSRMFDAPDPVSIGRGATLAHKCAICHGVHNAEQVNTPDLTGQAAAAIYKELQDFRSGARVSAVMSPQVTDLTDQDVRDLAVYFAYLPTALPAPNMAAPDIVATGAPMRNIPPCGACHGDPEIKPGAPRLEGESAAYIRDQLAAFVDDRRHNDISGQMRNIARHMTPSEIEATAAYFASGRADANR